MEINSKSFTEWTYDDIQNIIGNVAYQESDVLDYKENFKINDDFKNDVCAFANFKGGYFIFGISEKRDGKKKTGLAGSVCGIQNDGDDIFSQSIGNALSSSIEPSRPQFKTHLIPFNDGQKCILVLYINEGYNKPYISKQTKKFYIRGNSRKDDMSYQMIQDMFLSTFISQDRLNNFIDSRMKYLRNERNPQHLRYCEKPFISYYFISMKSIASKGNRYNINGDLQRYNELIKEVKSPWNSVIRSSVNVDGVLLHPLTIEDSLVHIQIFWDGTLEFTTTYSLNINDNGNRHIPGKLAMFLKQAIILVSQIYRDIELNDAIISAICCGNVGNIEYSDAESVCGTKNRKLFDRNDLQSSNIIIPSPKEGDLFNALSKMYDELGFMMGKNNFSQDVVKLIDNL